MLKTEVRKNEKLEGESDLELKRYKDLLGLREKEVQTLREDIE